MTWPWWLTKAGWHGYWEGFRVSFRETINGASRERALQSVRLSVYQSLKEDNPNEDWEEFCAYWDHVVSARRSHGKPR